MRPQGVPPRPDGRPTGVCIQRDAAAHCRPRGHLGPAVDARGAQQARAGQAPQRAHDRPGGVPRDNNHANDRRPARHWRAVAAAGRPAIPAAAPKRAAPPPPTRRPPPVADATAAAAAAGGRPTPAATTAGRPAEATADGGRPRRAPARGAGPRASRDSGGGPRPPPRAAASTGGRRHACRRRQRGGGSPPGGEPRTVLQRAPVTGAGGRHASAAAGSAAAPRCQGGFGRRVKSRTGGHGHCAAHTATITWGRSSASSEGARAVSVSGDWWRRATCRAGG